MKKLILLLLLPLCLLLSAQSQADSLTDAFGALINTTAPGAYNSQIRGFLSAGSINIAFPSEFVTIISITPPNFQQGCGGISMFLGGLAYINGAQFAQMLQQIAQAALGYTFQLALRTLCPVCSTILADLQKAAQMASQMAINQCQFAKGLVDKVADASGLNNYLQGEGASASAQSGKGGSSFLSDFNSFGADINKAWDSVQKFIDDVQTDAGKKQAKAEQPVGNSTWKAMPDADAVQKIFVMSLVGTVYRAPPKDGHSTFVQPTWATLSSKDLANLFVFGVKGKANQNLQLLECEDPSLYKDTGYTDKTCRTKRVPVSASYWYSQAKGSKGGGVIGGVSLVDYGFYGAVYALLMQAVENNRNQEKLGKHVSVDLPSTIYGSGTQTQVTAGFSADQIESFLATAPVPLYQAINLATWNVQVASALVSSISELVAAQYTLAFIEHMILDKSHIGNSKAGTIGGSPKAYKQLQDSLNAIHSKEIQIHSDVMRNFEIEQSWVGQLHSIQELMIGEIAKQGMSGSFALTSELSTGTERKTP